MMSILPDTGTRSLTLAAIALCTGIATYDASFRSAAAGLPREVLQAFSVVLLPLRQ